jgi:hypothetical protein
MDFTTLSCFSPISVSLPGAHLLDYVSDIGTFAVEASHVSNLSHVFSDAEEHSPKRARYFTEFSDVTMSAIETEKESGEESEESEEVSAIEVIDLVSLASTVPIYGGNGFEEGFNADYANPNPFYADWVGPADLVELYGTSSDDDESGSEYLPEENI